MVRNPSRPRSHVLGDVGRTFVKLQLEKWGWTADVVQSDYGEDLDCSVFTNGRRTALHFRCQIKASSSPKRNSAGEYSVRVSATTCAAWMQSYYPVFLVLFDQSANDAFFLNATGVLRKDPNALTHRHISFRIPSRSRLRRGRDTLIKSVQDHYAEFLRISDSVQCTAFPVLMPKYRMALPRTSFEIEGWDWENRHRDWLPAWTTVIETIDSEYLIGIGRKFARATVDEVYEELTTGLEKCEALSSSDQWMALACCPVRFIASPSEAPSMWTGELTGWRSFARLGGKVVDDRAYAFAPPSGFVTEVARHSLSWDDYYHVDAARDLAIQLYAATPLTPAYSGRSQSMRRNAAGQLLAWTCSPNRMAEVESALSSVGLVFSSIEKFSTEDAVVGVIHSPMFVVENGFTAMPIARDWETFDQGAVRKAITDLPAGTLPGAEAGNDVLEFALNQVPNLPLSPEETFYGVQHDVPMGLPVNLADRKILVERFHGLTALTEEETCDGLAADVQRKLSAACSSLKEAEVALGPFNTDLYPIIRLAVSWHPHLSQSSADAFLEVESVLLKEFDKLLPRRTRPGIGPHGTFDVLSFAGKIHFNPDYWDLWKART